MATNAYFLNQYVSTTLASVGGITDSATTGIILNSLTNIDYTKPGIACLSYTDPIDTSKAEWITYTSIDSGTKELQGVTRGQEGYAAKPHDNGVTVAFPLSKSHINNLNDALIIGGAETNLLEGILDEDDMASNSATKGVTQQSTKAYVDNGTWLKDSMARQAIINGNFDVWQRGTSLALTDVTVQRLADRWRDYISKDGGTLPTLTRSRQILTSGDIPNAFFYSRLTTNGAGSSLGANSQHLYSELIEHGVRNLCGNGKKVTVSFWARSDIANKKIGLLLNQQYGSGGSPTSAEEIAGANWTLTSTWTKYTHTFTTNTLVGKTFGTANDDALDCRFLIMWGDTKKTSVGADSAETYVGSGNIDIAQVQLCAGSVALPFMPKSFDEELRACQRYYEKLVYGEAFPSDTYTAAIRTYSQASTNIATNIFFKVPKRISPSVTSAIRYDINGGTNTTGNASVSNPFNFMLELSGITSGQHLDVHDFNADAEL